MRACSVYRQCEWRPNLLCDVVLVQRYMQLHDEVELSALGMGKSLPIEAFLLFVETPFPVNLILLLCCE